MSNEVNTDKRTHLTKSKGERLNWTPIKDIKPISLRAVLINNDFKLIKSERKTQKNKPAINILIP